jgi:hypothetical protein
MSACKQVKRWITEEVRRPVEEWVEESVEECREVRRWVEREVREPVERRRERTERRCRRRRCRRWCLCCNKWFCWLETIVEVFIEWVIKIVGEWLIETVCEIVVKMVKVIVEVIVTVTRLVVVGVVCLFTDPRSALDALIDAWYDITDIIGDIGDIIVTILDAASDAIDITRESILDMADKFGPVGRFFGGFIAGVLDIARKIIDGVSQAVDEIINFVNSILRLDFCSALESLVNAAIGAVQAGLGAANAALLGAGSVRDSFHRDNLRSWVHDELRKNFSGKGLEQMEDRLKIFGPSFGTDWNVHPMLCSISSRSKTISLRALHGKEVNLYEVAGYAPFGCKEKPFARSRYRLVYKNTNYRVALGDLRDYLNGDNNVAEFVLLSGELDVLKDMMQVAKRKFKQMAIHLKWQRLRTVELNANEFFITSSGAQNATDVTVFSERVSNLFNLNHTCDIPAIMVFDYKPQQFGLASVWWMGGTQTTTAATVRSNILAHVFGTLLAHEMGHCFSLCHAGHDGVDNIMYTADPQGNNCGNAHPTHNNLSGGLDWFTVKMLFEYLLIGGEPRFTLQDGKDAWAWILSIGRNCIR